jgi:hypothetical protein
MGKRICLLSTFLAYSKLTSQSLYEGKITLILRILVMESNSLHIQNINSFEASICARNYLRVFCKYPYSKFCKDIGIIIKQLGKDDLDEIISNMFTNKVIPGVNVSGTSPRPSILREEDCTLSLLPIIGNLTAIAASDIATYSASLNN